jgi:hypothetical protein
MLFVNRYSFLLAGAMVVIIASIFSALLGFSIVGLALVVVAILGSTALFRQLGAGRSSHAHSQPVLDLIGAGQPVLLMFQSAY